MKNYNLSSTFTVRPNGTQQIEKKEKYNVLNKNISNNKNEEKTNNYLNNYQKQNNKSNNKHRQYNSVLNINNINHNRNIDNNIDTNISYQKHPNKELISSMSLNYFEDIDEKLDIKLPYNNGKENITNSINTQLNNNQNNNVHSIRTKFYNENQKDKDKDKLNITSLNTNNNIKKQNESFHDKLFTTFSKIDNIFHLFQNGNNNDKTNLKTKIIENNKNDNRNITVGRNMTIQSKRNKDIEDKKSENNAINNSNLINRNNYYINKNKNIYKSYYINSNNCNGNLENDINKKNNILYSIGPSETYMKHYPNENKYILNFSNNNKKKFSVTKKDLRQFNKNEYYIQKIMENLPKSKNKIIRSNFNYDYRNQNNKNNNYYSKLNNKDNNVDFYYNNKNLYNNSIINNGDINRNNNIKTVRPSRYLSMRKQKTIVNNNKDEKYLNLKNNNLVKNNNNLNKYNRTFAEGFYINKSKKYIIKPLNSIKTKNYSEFIFNINNRRFKNKFISFLDIKTLLYLSSTNREFFIKTRDSLYLYLYNKLILDKNKDNFINQVLNSVKKFCSDKIKFKIKTKEIKDFYIKLLKKNEIYDDIIIKDLPRTLPNDSNFNKGKTSYNKLYNILSCFANYNKKIGYAQGLNFICAQAIYLFSLEEEVFVFLEGFINLMKMDNFIGVGNEKKMLYTLNEFSKILYKYVPKITKFFDDNSVSHDFFSTNWILTLFSTAMERYYLIIIWCFMIIFRWKFVYSFIIQILKKYERSITSSEEGQLCYIMKNILRQKDFKNDFNNIIKNTFDFMKNNIVL